MARHGSRPMKSITAPASGSAGAKIGLDEERTRTEALGCAGEGRAKLREREERAHREDEDARGYTLPEEHVHDTGDHECQRHEPYYTQAVSTSRPFVRKKNPRTDDEYDEDGIQPDHGSARDLDVFDDRAEVVLDVGRVLELNVEPTIRRNEWLAHDSGRAVSTTWLTLQYRSSSQWRC